MKTISIFTPCYNEEGNVYTIYKAVAGIMDRMPQYRFEYIFIDNCSTDRTPSILKEIAEQDKRVKVIFNARNFGVDRSSAYGFFQTTGDATISLVCDLQDPPEMIPDFIEQWEIGYKIVWGRKISSSEKRSMYFVRSFFYKFIKTLSATPQYEHVTGFGLYDREVVEQLKQMEEPKPSFRHLIAELGYEVKILDYHQSQRRSGKSSYNFLKYLDAAMSSLINTSRLPLRILTLCGLFFSLCSFMVGLIYLILKIIFWSNFNAGVAPLIIGMFFLGSIQLIFTGIIGEYVGEILTRVTKRPLVIEKERINFDEN
jgi:glycosyltransferase involved in cell wall biosynthesis